MNSLEKVKVMVQKDETVKIQIVVVITSSMVVSIIALASSHHHRRWQQHIHHRRISQQSVRVSALVSNHDRSDPKHAARTTTRAQYYQLPHQACLLLGYHTGVASLSNSLHDTH